MNPSDQLPRRRNWIPALFTIGRYTKTRPRKTRRPRRPPEGAHGRRNIDGSYFAIWKCQRGHGGVGDPDKAPQIGCFNVECLGEPTVWARCSPKEAHDFLFKLEGFGMYNGVGFELMEDTRAAL
jgi:hypothetical protein